MQSSALYLCLDGLLVIWLIEVLGHFGAFWGSSCQPFSYLVSAWGVLTAQSLARRLPSAGRGVKSQGRRCGRASPMALSWMERIAGWEEQGHLRIAELLHKSSFRSKELKERERKT